jgi:two-component system, NarL family, nitrate/nitrite sensor histidine kinase NarX
MREAPPLVTTAGEKILRWRWAIMAVLGLFNIAVESVEEGSVFSRTPDAFYIIEVLLFGVVGPLCGGLALTVIAKSRQRQQSANRYLARHKELVALLASTRDWDELTTLVVRFPRNVVLLRGACLLVHDQVESRYRPDAQWWDLNEAIPSNLASLCTPDACTACAQGQAAPLAGSAPERCKSERENPATGDRYCLPLTYRNRPTALLHLFLPPGTCMDEDQVESLSAMAASMAIAIHDAQPQRAAVIRAIAADAERQRIARDLHDTLGQSLGYLRLKLEQLTGDDPLRELRDIRQELEQMRAVVGDAYLQVRTTISALHTAPPDDLESALERQARKAAERSGFEFRLAREGAPRPLSPQTQRQVLYLLGEALNNVEKHAAAAHVDILLAWRDDSLEIRFADDGRGFNADAAQADGHFGLGIMRQRALAVDGRLTISSVPELGTEMCLTLPLEPGLRLSPVGGEL